MNKVFTFVLTMLTFYLSQAQEINTMSKTMSLGPQTAYYVTIDGADEDMSEKAWKDFIKDYGKTKWNKKAKEYFTNGIKVPMINGTSLLDLYTKIEEGKGQSTLFMWVDLGGAFASPEQNKTQSAGIETFLSDYFVFLKKRVINEELASEEKKLKGFEKDLSKLEKKNSDLHEDIENYKKKIAEAEQNIEKNLNEQDNKRVEIGTQSKVIEGVVERLNNVGKGN